MTRGVVRGPGRGGPGIEDYWGGNCGQTLASALWGWVGMQHFAQGVNSVPAYGSHERCKAVGTDVGEGFNGLCFD